MDMVVAAGKSRKNVDAFILIPSDAKTGIDLLLQHRSAAGVPTDNPYMFARMNSLTPLSGHTELRDVIKACPQLQHPQDITSGSLRKYVATVSQVHFYFVTNTLMKALICIVVMRIVRHVGLLCKINFVT